MDKKFALAAAFAGIVILILLSAATVHKINETFNESGPLLFLLAAVFVLIAYFIDEIKNKILNKFKK